MPLREPALQVLGSAGCQPVLFGSLPKKSSLKRRLIFSVAKQGIVVGKLPTTAG
jgi:hypothetical protein